MPEIYLLVTIQALPKTSQKHHVWLSQSVSLFRIIQMTSDFVKMLNYACRWHFSFESSFRFHLLGVIHVCSCMAIFECHALQGVSRIGCHPNTGFESLVARLLTSRMGRTTPYIGSLEARVTASNKERVYDLVRPTPNFNTFQVSKAPLHLDIHPITQTQWWTSLVQEKSLKQSDVHIFAKVTWFMRLGRLEIRYRCISYCLCPYAWSDVAQLLEIRATKASKLDLWNHAFFWPYSYL